MSTRSNISILFKNEELFTTVNNVTIDGKYGTIYCHHDGYIKGGGVGNVLYKHYNTYEKVKALILGGACSSISEKGAAYYVDDNPNIDIKFSIDEPKLNEEYLYIFRDNEWYVKNKYDGDEFTKLSTYFVEVKNNVDSQYLNLLNDIVNNGNHKITRSGGVKSIFDRTMRFNLKEGFPLLTTKKVFTKGVIHELLWFLKGDTNIKYLVDNNVHIWDDDAYRFYLGKINKHNELVDKISKIMKSKDETLEFYYDSYVEGNADIDVYDTFKPKHFKNVTPLSKEDYLKCVKNEEYVTILNDVHSYTHDNKGFAEDMGEEEMKRIGVSYNEKTDRFVKCNDFSVCDYVYGDLGPVYGKQWRNFGRKSIDQVQNIIDKLNNNPDDRRIILSAWNPNDMNEMALPPCHVFSMYYTRELSLKERQDWFNNKNKTNLSLDSEGLDKLNVPKRELSCSFTTRSQDSPLGTPYNIASYALLTHMIAQTVNMSVGELIWHGMDCHIYDNQMEGVLEQLSRDPKKYELPTLVLNPDIKNIDDFKFEDIKIENYESYPSIIFPLSVG